MKHNITAIRRIRKTDNNRIARSVVPCMSVLTFFAILCLCPHVFACRACGATIVNRTDEIKEGDVGTGAGLFEIKKVGDEFVFSLSRCFIYSFIIIIGYCQHPTHFSLHFFPAELSIYEGFIFTLANFV
jgi:hypothetical protein